MAVFMNILADSFRLGTKKLLQTLARPSVSGPPLRSELFNIEQLERHAKSMAGYHTVGTRWISKSLLARLDDNEAVLRAFTPDPSSKERSRTITPAAEWLLDNFYLIEEQIQLARRHLPRGYNRGLPFLLNGPSSGYPRVYDIVLELISHLDAQIDMESLSAFIAAYQTVASLQLGELWAIPIMLRMALIENLRRVTTRLAQAQSDSDLADSWTHRLREMTEGSPTHLVIVLAEMAKADLPLSSAFVAEFFQNLSRENPALHLARSWLEQRLVENGLSIAQLVHQESQNQASDQVSVRHSINSLRFLNNLDWKEFVETLSAVHEILRKDPASVYDRMDFATRDRYRHSIETLSRHGSLSETEIAELVIGMAETGALQKGIDDRTAHVGYYLIGKGEPHLRRLALARLPLRTLFERSIRKFPLTFYVGGITCLTLSAVWACIRFLWGFESHGLNLVGVAILLLLGISQAAAALMNLLSSILVKPLLLPRMDFTQGIAPDCCSVPFTYRLFTKCRMEPITPNP